MRLSAIHKTMKVLAAMLALSACQNMTPEPPRPPQTPKPKPPMVAALTMPGTTSAALVDYYAGIQRTLLIQDQLRTDGGGPDVPFTSTMLARNFERIALNREYKVIGNRRVTQENAIHLTRWSKPVRFSLSFGPRVAKETAAKDRATYDKYVRRLARVTGHPISDASTRPNFRVYVLNEEDRRAFGPEIRRAMPGISSRDVLEITNLSRENYCVVLALDHGNKGRFDAAIAVIRAELPDLMRAACLHEEMAQGLGLSNDHPKARPSIFNDDEEFGLLTTHDEYLLRMLYDDRLQPGMSAAQARPIIREIAAELVGGSV